MIVWYVFNPLAYFKVLKWGKLCQIIYSYLWLKTRFKDALNSWSDIKINVSSKLSPPSKLAVVFSLLFKFLEMCRMQKSCVVFKNTLFEFPCQVLIINLDLGNHNGRWVKILHNSYCLDFLNAKYKLIFLSFEKRERLIILKWFSWDPVLLIGDCHS